MARILTILPLVLLLMLFGLVSLSFAQATFLPGRLDTAEIKATVTFTNLYRQWDEWGPIASIFGDQRLSVADGYWQPGGDSVIWIYYFPGQLYVQIDNYGAGLVSYAGLPLQGPGWEALNYIEIHVQSSPTYPIQWYVDYVGSPPNLRWDSNAIPGAEKTVYAFDFDLASGFQMGSRLTIPNIPPPAGAESLQVEVKFGYVPPRVMDEKAPVVSPPAIADTLLVNSVRHVSVSADDRGRGDSHIASIAYNINGGPFVEMPPLDGFDSPAEWALSEPLPWTEVGPQLLCAKASDVKGNESDPWDIEGNEGVHPCRYLYVDYGFEGFYAPISTATANEVKAGQTVPVKWRLTDANGAPITDPESFQGLYSYGINCATLSGKVVDVVEDYAAGSSGLQYLGDGYWQFNWKTPKSYADTCRTMFIEWKSTTLSPLVDVKFTK